MPEFTNIAAYKFARLSGLKELRERLLRQCRGWGLKGTILLSTEGINLFMAGGKAEVDSLVAELIRIAGLETLAPKYSLSDHQPFSRLLVRIKKEIIAFGVEGIDPAGRTSPKLAPATLKQWLDEGRPVTLLDTRNDYEVKLGTFEGAVTLNIQHFRQFPEAVHQLSPTLKDQPVVMFCTGGIRCEKAGPFMEREGFQKVHQLEGGILKYFEECGGAHYTGECFVFDRRVGLDPSLSETEATQCFVCQTPLDEGEQADPRFVPGQSCPYCFKTSAQQMKEALARRHAAIRRVTTPLPGSAPYENRRPLNVPGEHEGRSFLDCLCHLFPHIGREEWLRRCDSGRFVDDAGGMVNAERIVRAGERYQQIFPMAAEPDVNAAVRILYEDETLFVVDKPAPLPMHPCGRYHRNSLQFILDEVYSPQRPRFVHRLDSNTTGLVLCARTRHFAALLHQRFVCGDIRKTYLVRVQGHPEQDRFVCDEPIGTEAGRLGSRCIDRNDGQSARTEFSVLRRDPDGNALLEAHPITGRTNQIRVHLWHLGLPVLGDTAYRPGQLLGEMQTISPLDSPMCLHAWRLEFKHPQTHAPLCFEVQPPPW